MYKVRWKGEEGRAEEAIVPVLDEETTTCSFRLKVHFLLLQKWFLFCLLQDLMDGVQYKVNITALVDDYKDYKVTDSKRPESVRMSVEPSTAVESKALHEKVSLSETIRRHFVPWTFCRKEILCILHFAVMHMISLTR